MVATFLVFRLMVYDRTIHFDFTGREITLEVFHVRRSVPKAPLGEREQLETSRTVAPVGQSQFLNLAPHSQRHEKQHTRFDAVLRPRDACIAHSMTAFIKIKRSLAWFPTRRPYRSAVIYIEIPAAVVHRDIIIAVACYPAELGILAEGISTGGVGYQ